MAGMGDGGDMVVTTIEDTMSERLGTEDIVVMIRTVDTQMMVEKAVMDRMSEKAPIFRMIENVEGVTRPMSTESSWESVSGIGLIPATDMTGGLAHSLQGMIEGTGSGLGTAVAPEIP